MSNLMTCLGSVKSTERRNEYDFTYPEMILKRPILIAKQPF